MPSPDTLMWLVTGRCNLTCSHCYASRFQGGEELSPAEAQALVAEAARAGVGHLGLAGGEPLLRRDLLGIVHKARSLGLGVSLVTNGWPVTPGLARALAHDDVRVVVSLDGARPETHDRRRGAGSQGRALAALNLLRQAGVAVRTVMALGADNYPEVGEYLALVRGLGVEAACLIPVMLSGRAGREGLVSGEQLLSALGEVERGSRELGLPVQLWCLPFAPLVVTSPMVSAFSCRPGHTIDLDPSGHVLLCDVLDTVVSHIRGQGLAAAWQEQQRSPLVRRLANPRLAPVCAACPLARSCRGGCFARAQLLSGDLYAPDPLCPRVAGQRMAGKQSPP